MLSLVISNQLLRIAFYSLSKFEAILHLEHLQGSCRALLGGTQLS